MNKIIKMIIRVLKALLPKSKNKIKHNTIE